MPLFQDGVELPHHFQTFLPPHLPSPPPQPLVGSLGLAGQTPKSTKTATPGHIIFSLLERSAPVCGVRKNEDEDGTGEQPEERPFQQLINLQVLESTSTVFPGNISLSS